MRSLPAQRAAELTVMTYPSTGWVFGGALDRVVNEMVSPVIVVRGKEGQPPPQFECGTIIAPVKQSARSKTALPTALELCRTLGAKLQLLTVVEPVAGAYDKANPPPEIQTYLEEQWLAAEQMLSTTAAGLTGAGVEVDYALSLGDPAREIIRRRPRERRRPDRDALTGERLAEQDDGKRRDRGHAGKPCALPARARAGSPPKRPSATDVLRLIRERLLPCL